jgi:magnesium chelatase family protein
MIGPPGSGKTMLARRLPGILPPMTLAEALEVTGVHSVAGCLPPGEAVVTARPFRAPHHTVSDAGMVGGGTPIRPGEISLAHHGVLFLDELAEFDRDVLDALRQPLEDGHVEVERVHGSVRYPARLQLIAAMNPCRCGWHGDPERTCRCLPREPERYVRRVSGPLLDRIDLRVVMPRMAAEQLVAPTQPEESKVAAARIERAFARALDRNGGVPNADLRGRSVLHACALDRRTRLAVSDIAASLELTARGVHRMLRVARTIADLRGRERVSGDELYAAASLRDRSMEVAEAA